MNDRFKFRVWLEYAKLYYGLDSFYYDRLRNKYTFHFEDGHTKTIKEKDCVIEQCTGLKDKNGRLIYEGDVVEYYNKEIKKTFKEEVLPFRELKTKGILRHLITERNAVMLAIVGNIHENPELMEE